MRLQITQTTETPARVDSWLAEELEKLGLNLSRSGIKRLLLDGDVTINDKPVKPSYQIKNGDSLDVFVPDPVEPEAIPEDIPLDVVYEDSSLIVVNKPQGMVVHPAPGHPNGTLVNGLLFHCRGTLSGVNGVLRPGIVHRIDRDTSGLLVAAKTDAAHHSISEQLQARSVLRAYYAIARGRISEELTIDKPIFRHKGHKETQRKKMAVAPSGKEAITHITPIRLLEGSGVFTYLEARLKTGRTHQIRVHLASINRPVLGDTLYGGENQPYGLCGQVLHAGLLGFNHPENGEYVEFKADLPDYFKSLLDRLS